MEEKAIGPLRIQGDHGSIAFRNLMLFNYDKPQPELKNIQYSIYEGKFTQLPSFDNLSTESEGASKILTSSLATKSKSFLIRYTGVLYVKESGEYTFNLNLPGGSGLLRFLFNRG